MKPFSRSSCSLQGSVYSQLAHRLANHDGPIYPLHIGDTWMEPAEGCRLEDQRVADHPGMHRYAKVQGLPELVGALARRTSERTGLRTTGDEVLVTAGGTGGLAAVVGALVDPGARVVIVAPHWPLIAGMVKAFHGEPVVLPLLGAVQTADSPRSVPIATNPAATIATAVSATSTNRRGRVATRRRQPVVSGGGDAGSVVSTATAGGSGSDTSVDSGTSFVSLTTPTS